MYSLRYEKHTTGETGYNTKCSNFWSDQCPRKFGTKIQCRNCEYRKWKPLELVKFYSIFAYNKDVNRNNIIREGVDGINIL